jgi:hypothetical protein
MKSGCAVLSRLTARSAARSVNLKREANSATARTSRGLWFGRSSRLH